MSDRQAVNVVADVDKSRHKGLRVADRHSGMEMKTQCILQAAPERDTALIPLGTLMVRRVVRREEMRNDAVKQGKHSSLLSNCVRLQNLSLPSMTSHTPSIRDNTLDIPIRRPLSSP